MLTLASFAAAVKPMLVPMPATTLVVGSSGAGKSFFSALSHYVVAINQDDALRQLLGSAMSKAVDAHKSLGFVWISEEPVQGLSRSSSSFCLSRTCVLEDPVDGGQLDVAAVLGLLPVVGGVTLTLRLRCAPKGSLVAEDDCSDAKVTSMQMTMAELLAGEEAEWGVRCISRLQAELPEGLEVAVADAAERLVHGTTLALAR